MFLFNELLDSIPKMTVSFPAEFEISPSNAKKWLAELSKKLDANCPLYYNRIIIDSSIELLIPGKYDHLYPGDYLLTLNNKFPSHLDVCDRLRNAILDRDCNPKTEYKHSAKGLFL